MKCASKKLFRQKSNTLIIAGRLINVDSYGFLTELIVYKDEKRLCSTKFLISYF